MQPVGHRLVVAVAADARELLEAGGRRPRGTTRHAICRRRRWTRPARAPSGRPMANQVWRSAVMPDAGRRADIHGRPAAASSSGEGETAQRTRSGLREFLALRSPREVQSRRRLHQFTDALCARIQRPSRDPILNNDYARACGCAFWPLAVLHRRSRSIPTGGPLAIWSALGATAKTAALRQFLSASIRVVWHRGSDVRKCSST